MTKPSDNGKYGFTPEEYALARKTTCKELSEEHLDLFAFKCQRYGSHILDGQLYPTVHTNQRTGDKTLSLIVGIDFMRNIAAKTHEHVGTSLPAFSGIKGKSDWRVRMKVERLVQGIKAEFWAEVAWAEYYPGKNFMWDSKSETMIAKVCESHCLRKGFPVELSGLYTAEEFAITTQAEHSYSKTFTQDFPPDTNLSGRLESITFPEAGQPGTALILTENFASPLPFQVMSEHADWLSLVGQSVVYRWVKPRNSRAGVMSLVEMRAADAAPKPLTTFSPEPQEPSITIHHPEGSAAADIADEEWDKAHPMTPDESQDDDTDDAFTPGRTVRGFVTKITSKAGKAKSSGKPWEKTTFIIEPFEGPEITCSTFAAPMHFKFRTFQEVYQTGVLFTCVEGNEFPKNSGKYPLELESIELDPLWSEEAGDDDDPILPGAGVPPKLQPPSQGEYQAGPPQDEEEAEQMSLMGRGD